MQYYRHTDLLLALLRLALWDERASIESLKPISREEWNVAFQLSTHHAVLGIAWQGISKLNADELPPDDLLCIWTAKATAIEAVSSKMNAVLADLLHYFQSHGLHPVVMKGQAIAALYSKPLLRETGDIDIYFADNEELKKCLAMLVAYVVAPDGSARSHYKGVEIDVHKRLIDICNPFASKALRSLLSQNAHVEMQAAHGLTLTVPNPEMTIALLSTHIMKHTIGRGIGLRQMCDLAIACSTYKKAIDPSRMKDISHSLGLSKWDREVYSFLVNQLKMPRAFLPYDIDIHRSRALADRVLFGGNFGRIAYPRVTDNTAKRKGITAYALLKNSLWSLRFAPMESISTFLNLSIGQFRRRK